MRYKCVVGFNAKNRHGKYKRKISMGSLWEMVDLLSFGRPSKSDNIRLRRVWKNNSSLRLDDIIIDSEKLNLCFQQIDVTINNQKWKQTKENDGGKRD